MTQMNLSMKKKQIHRRRELTCGCQGERGVDWKFGICKCKLLYVEWINNKAPLYSMGNNIQHPVINHTGKEYICIYIYIYTHTNLNHFAVQQKVTAL